MTVWILLSTAMCAAPGPAAEWRISPERPRVLATAAELERVRERSRREPWAMEVTAALTREAEELVDASLDIPRQGGQWSHYYTAEDGVRLRPRSPNEHVHPRTGDIYTGPLYDAAYAGMMHGRWLRGIQTLGMAYALTQRREFAERARRILIEYAEFYRELPLTNKHGRRASSAARLFAQTLDEAVALCHVVAGYDLVYTAPCFSDADHERIEHGLIRPAVRVVQRNNSGAGNWQAWHNAAAACAGLLLGDERMADWAVNGRSGFRFQLERSLLPSGLWFEEAMIYHWYALNAHIYLMEAAARNGLDLYGEPMARRMFDAPARQLLPGQTFAPLHNSDRLALSDDRHFFEIAFRRYGDPAYAALAGPRPTGDGITHASEDLPESRTLGLESAALSLFWGAGRLPEDRPLPHAALHSSAGEAEGLAVLRGTGNRTVVLLDYGPGLAGHVHPAKLNLVLYAHGNIRLADPGRAPYANRLQDDWYRQTIAHNTVVVNETSQRRTRGELVSFEKGDGWTRVRVRCDTAYRGAQLERTVTLREHEVEDVVECTARGRRTFDLPMHFRGTLEDLPRLIPRDGLSGARGYRELTGVHEAVGAIGAFTVRTGPDSRIQVLCLDESAGWTALAPGPAGTGERFSTVIRRQHGRTARFHTLFRFDPDGEASD